jgi:hypothetical protein
MIARIDFNGAETHSLMGFCNGRELTAFNTSKMTVPT